MDKIELRGPKQIIQKRKKVFSTLNMEEVEALKASENAEWVAKEFDRIILKLLRLIQYSTDKDNAEKTKLEQDTNNLIKRLLNRWKYKELTEKMDNVQKYFFEDICNFVNFFVDDSYLSAVHNNIPTTSLSEFSEKSIWNQIFQNFYARNRWNEGICEWWSCSYRAILLYNFFNKLKEAWLDMKISFYRYKKLDDKSVPFPTQRHSWLIINFQWVDYMVDRDGVIYDNKKTIVRELQPYIDIASKSYESKDVQLFENFKYENRKETDSVIFFDDLNNFIQHCEKYPEHIRVAFYAQSPDNSGVENINFEFWNSSFGLWSVEYYLKDNDLPMNNLIKNLIKKVFVKRTEDKFEEVTAEDREKLRKYFSLIKDKVDLNKLHEKFTSWAARKAELCDFNWSTNVFRIAR